MAWLSKQLGFEVRLPTEAQWEKAARGVDGRIYPWDSEFDARRCNVKNTGIGHTCAVGIFPLPDGPWKDNPLDMSGNVWEWCFSKYAKYPYDESDGRNDKDGTNRRVVRGGSFVYSGGDARAASRLNPVPVNANFDYGLRVSAPMP